MKNDLQPHIRCSSSDAAKYAILPGDPKRVLRVKTFLEDAKEIAFNREFKSVSGYYKGVKVMCVSTGIGGASLAIAAEELGHIGVKTLIRIGSCGAIDKTLKLGDLIIASGALRDEGLTDAYVDKMYPAYADTDTFLAIRESAKKQGFAHACGVVRSHEGLYTDDDADKDNKWGFKNILGSDMETSSLFVVGRLRGLNTGSILNVVQENGEDVGDNINDYVNGNKADDEGEKKEILTALEKVLFFQ